ncbi:ATP-binding protein [Tellurirhabdus rosea]|uniref:ATP-binding protein n=1 Tax=Tellurirhabdus rosea TaxID=2674997 RepID=UPI0022515043|nr:ATP-binding protein [Tellurirhabdus rosea]
MTIPLVDLSTCEQEPIHIPGYIQAHGHLVALSRDNLTIQYVSAQIEDFCGTAPAQLLGAPLNALLSATEQSPEALVNLIRVIQRSDSPSGINPQRFTIMGQPWDLVVHEHGGLILLEWEPTIESTGAFRHQPLIAEALAELQSSKSLEELLQNTARRVRTIIGFDRVMVYRFGADWHGQVIAEDKADEMETYMDLHFPASDIPKQARELYRLNPVRLIVDTYSQPTAILSRHPAPLDMTHAGLRAVSPVHIEYLRNMNVGASMSLSLLYRGKLWGLMTCHHSEARFIDYPTRQAAQFVSQLLSAALEFRESEADASQRRQFLDHEHTLHQQLLQDANLFSALTAHPVTALDVTSATGAALIYNGRIHQLGQTPDEKSLERLAEWLNKHPFDVFHQTHRLPDEFPEAASYSEVAAGMLAIVLSREMGEYLLWFKPEQLREVTWAGNPEKSVTVQEEGGLRLSPRKSFEAWSQTVRHTSQPWSDAELSAVLKLRENVLQAITRQANQLRQLNRQLQMAYEELDAFSYTVSHDLRTPLSSIRYFADILEEDYGTNLDDDARQLLTKIIQSTDRLGELISHILNYSRMGRSEIHRLEVPMRPLLDQIREEVLIDSHHSAVTIELGDTPPLLGDPTMLAQVFTNLLTNAVKYSKPIAAPRVFIEGRRAPGEVIYSVQDNGIGFDMKKAGRMFELFRRLDNAIEIEGSGVGLSIVKRIVGRHGGKIWYQSAVGQGTTFWVSFPDTN